MNRFLCLILTPLVCAGWVVAAPPEFQDNESFDEFRVRWNVWVGSLPKDQASLDELTRLLEELENHLRDSDKPWGWDVMLKAEPGNEYWEYAPRVFEDHRDLFDLINQASRGSNLALPIPEFDGNDESVMTPFDQVAEQLNSSSFKVYDIVSPLCEHAMYLAYTGEVDAAIDRFETIVIVHERTVMLPTIINSMIRRGISESVRNCVFELLYSWEEVGFSDEQLARLQQLLLRMEPEPLGPIIAFENRVNRETWHAMYVDDKYDMDYEFMLREAALMIEEFFEPVPPILPTLDPIPDVPLASPDAQYERVQAISAAFMKDLADGSPMQEMIHVVPAYIEQFGTEDEIDRYTIAYQHTRLWRVILGFQWREKYRNFNAQVVIALHRHRVRHSDWPETLDDIEPEVLSLPAIDLFNGKPLGYEVVNGQPWLYGFGIDRDDDGGRPIRSREFDGPSKTYLSWLALDELNALSEIQREAYDGDVLIYQSVNPDYDD